MCPDKPLVEYCLLVTLSVAVPGVLKEQLKGEVVFCLVLLVDENIVVISGFIVFLLLLNSGK